MIRSGRCIQVKQQTIRSCVSKKAWSCVYTRSRDMESYDAMPAPPSSGAFDNPKDSYCIFIPSYSFFEFAAAGFIKPLLACASLFSSMRRSLFINWIPDFLPSYLFTVTGLNLFLGRSFFSFFRVLKDLEKKPSRLTIFIQILKKPKKGLLALQLEKLAHTPRL